MSAHLFFTFFSRGRGRRSPRPGRAGLRRNRRVAAAYGDAYIRSERSKSLKNSVRDTALMHARWTSRTALMHAKPHTKRAILKLRLKATLDFGPFSARPPFLSLCAQMSNTRRVSVLWSVECVRQAEPSRATRQARQPRQSGERGWRRWCNAPEPSRRSPRPGRSPVGRGLDTPGARTQDAPSTAAFERPQHLLDENVKW